MKKRTLRKAKTDIIEALDCVYVNVFNEVVKVKKEIIDMRAASEEGWRVVADAVESLKMREYPVQVIVRSHGPPHMTMGRIVWLKRGERERLSFQPDVTYNSLTVECYGGFINECLLANRHFLNSSSLVCKVDCVGVELSPAGVLQVGIILPKERAGY